ncbi:hypothetical protein LB507_010194 [Fusarium sp. FIESC RH6]|nr:hypothetical protein LB507_010194 [Fusarium sp. FIESC RH6]
MAVTKLGLLTFLAMGAAQVSGRSQVQEPAKSPLMNQMTPQGCFSALPSDADSHGSGPFMANGACGDSCTKENKLVAITFGSTCYCSDKYPAKSSLVDDSSCDEPCPGYAMEACGGMDPKSYSVFNTGLDLAPEYDDGEDDDGDAASSATEAPFSASASVVSTKFTSATGIPSTTETEEVSSATASPEETSPVLPVTASQIPPVVKEQTAAATPSASASTVLENASPRLSNPIGNIVRMMMNLL